MAKHATLSASSSHRWLTCTASVKACANIKDKGSSAAQEGTRAHEVADRALRAECDASEFIGQTIEGGVVDKTMVDYVQEYLDYVRSFVQSKDDVLMPEQRVDYSNYIPKGFGTSDAIVISGDTMHVCDLKYGKGVQVFAEENSQGMLYAIGALNDYGFIYDVEKIVIHIIQPRLNHFDEWEISVPHLIDWAEWASERAHEALSDNGQFAPSEKGCQFCPNNATCEALYEHTTKIIASDFDDLDGKEIPKEPHDRLKSIMDNADLIISYINRVKDYVKEQIESGVGFDGYKLVAGRSVRKLKPDAMERLEELYGDDVYEKKPKTLGNLEKLVGKKQFAEMGLTDKPEGKPTVVPESDKRPSLNAGCEFESL